MCKNYFLLFECIINDKMNNVNGEILLSFCINVYFLFINYLKVFPF